MTGKNITMCVLPHAGGYHNAAWRRPDGGSDRIWEWEQWKCIAQTAERGLFDAIFIADLVALWPIREDLRHLTTKVGQWDAFTLAAAMAVVTERIGIVATAHTEYNEPYNIARRVASLDHLSRGRAGWNVVTSASQDQAVNFGFDAQIPREERYRRAWEFVEVVTKLWDTWEDDSYLVDKEAGAFYDPTKVRLVEHSGEHYRVRGPLNVMRPPQGHPVIAQAGASGPGRRLAAGIGEIVFTPHSGEVAKAYYDEVKQAAVEMGRDPDDVKILSQINPIVASTDQAAEAEWQRLQEMLDPRLAISTLEFMLDTDLAGLGLDDPIPVPEGESSRLQGYREAVAHEIKTGNPTLRDLLHRYRGPGTQVGSAATIADYMETEVDNGSCDGFVLLLQGVPDELESFVEHVVPELQARGRYRAAYDSSTLRGHLGLGRPANTLVGKSRLLSTLSQKNEGPVS